MSAIQLPPPVPINMGVRSNPGKEPAAGVAELINCRVEDAGQEGKIRWPIYACDGFALFGSAFSGTGVSGEPRCEFAFSDTVAYLVVGTRVVKLTSTGSWSLLTGSVSGSGRVTMARNRKTPDAQVGIVTSDGHFYIIEADVLTEITLPVDAPTINSIDGLDGYFLLTDVDGEFYTTSIDEGSEIDDLDFAAAESNPDGLLRVIVRGRDALMMGPESTEQWNDTGATDFPFERSDAKTFGLYAVSSPVAMLALVDGAIEDSVIFAGSGKGGSYAGVMVLQGMTPSKISPPGLDRDILSETDTSMIKAFATNEGGKPIYTISGTDWTWQYSTTTGDWNKRKSDGLDRWRIGGAMTFAGMQIVSDYALSKVYWMRSGLYAAAASVLTVRHSNDNGDTWRATRSKTLSASNKKERASFWRLGQSKSAGKVFEITISNAISEDGTGVDMVLVPPTIHAWPKPIRFFAIHVDVIPGASSNATNKGLTGLAVRPKTLAV